jgi:hypothetical protein
LGLFAAYVATFFVDTNILTLILSFSPGGIYEVAVIAIAFDLRPRLCRFSSYNKIAIYTIHCSHIFESIRKN